MKSFVFLIALLLPVAAAAQPAPVPIPPRIQNAGTNLPRHWTLNCTGALTCSDDAANNRTTLSAAGASLGNFVFSGNGMDLSGAAQMTIANATATSVKMLNALQFTTSTPNLSAPGFYCTAGGQCSFESNANSIMINGTAAGNSGAYLYFSLGSNWIMRMGAANYNNSLSPTVDIAGNLGDTVGNHGWGYLLVQHLIGDQNPGATTASTPPANVQFGVAPSITVSGSDMAMTLTLTTGTGPTAFVGGTKVAVSTVTFKTAYGAAPSTIVCSPANDKAGAAASGSTGVEFFADTPLAGSFVLEAVDSGAGSLTASTAYKIACLVVQ